MTKQAVSQDLVPRNQEVVEAEYEPLPEVKSILDLAPGVFAKGLERRGKNRLALMAWVRGALVQGIDYDRIHVIPKKDCPKGKYCTIPGHFSKPTLFKSGAEKIAGMLGLRFRWPGLKSYEARAIAGERIQLIILRCEMVDSTGQVVAEGAGGRTMGQDNEDINKVLKMAKKSGMIDSVLNCGGLSEVFSQDLEDMDPKDIDPEDGPPSLPLVCPFGEKAGMPWADQDDGLLDWIIDKGKIKDPAMIAAAKAEKEKRAADIAELRATGKETSISDALRELLAAKTLEELKTAWGGLNEEEKKECVSTKNLRRRELMKKDEATKATEEPPAPQEPAFDDDIPY